jgi:hypothetical protein
VLLLRMVAIGTSSLYSDDQVGKTIGQTGKREKHARLVNVEGNLLCYTAIIV